MKANWGERHYLPERVKIFWRTFQHTLRPHFDEAVTQLVANSLRPPMLDDLSKAIEAAKVAANQSSWRSVETSFTAALEEAARNNKKGDREFVQACTQLLRDKLTGNLKRDQFLQGCDYLDQAAKVFSGPKREP